MPAWVDKTGTMFFYDGVSFWRHTRSGRRKLVPSWQSPPYGWMHQRDCTCSLCWADVAQQQRQAA